ncbi:CmcI family methyltransferase [Desulfobacter postgatei]|jgi:cephalosporin hydroxylase|uniref:CmcI family methyltransferase n=1 Tax=Desulfobacter postgatei TaxID=2293 RepID=UPI002A36CDCE|nr:CmcI family methyltransferase [Desulfobacter postgatei]MDX9964142.1 CmcI family methyltransferase [Desulfobacter postgatei]
MNRFKLTNEFNMDITISKQEIINAFHCIFYANESNHSGPPNLYNGVPIHKNPLDLFNYQQILFEQRPDYIIECGAYQGGSTLYFADILNTIGHGKIISIDICERQESWYPKVHEHERTILIEGSSVDKNIVDKVKEIVTGSKSVFVILDSLHTRDHVLSEMNSYADLLSSGNYMIVEDSNLNGHPLPPQWHSGTMTEGGPFEAIEKYLSQNDTLIVDRELENRFLFSYAPFGYLKKK